MKLAVFGIGFVVFASLAMTLSGIVPLDIMLEINAIIIAVAVTGFCLHHIYNEHQLHYEVECRLRNRLFIKIQDLDPGLSNYRALSRYVEYLLNTDSDEKRLKKLTAYQENTQSLERFIQRFKRYQSTHKTLIDLGLSW